MPQSPHTVPDYRSHWHAIRDKSLRMFIEREELTPRTSMENERVLFAMIRDGDIAGINRMLGDAPMTAGTMSANTLRQAQYMAVSFIALGTRVAIEGGVTETDAFSMSDYFIQIVDSMDTPDEVYSMIFDMMKVLAVSVREAKLSKNYSDCVNKCVDYIFKNLHFRISLEALSRHANLSREHLARVFRRETGRTIAGFIMEEKLKLSYDLLKTGRMDSREIAHTLSFCSQSHFISCFKKRYGITPLQLQRDKTGYG